MPLFEYAGPGPRVYPETRDAKGANLSEIQVGDRREFDAPPDQWWVPVSVGGQGEPGPDGSEDAGAGQEGDAPDPAAPQPVPPAVIPQ